MRVWFGDKRTTATLALLLAVAGCSGDALVPEPTSVKIQGTVIAAADRTPISDARVDLVGRFNNDTLNYATTFTDALGRFSIDHIAQCIRNSEPFDYVRATAEGYLAQTSVNVGVPVRCTNNVVTINFVLNTQ